MNTNKVATRRDVALNETDFWFFKRTNVEGISAPTESLSECEDTDESLSEAPPRRSQKTVQHPDYYGYSEPTDTTTNECADTATLVKHSACSAQEIPEPATIDEALGSPHAREWKLATDSE